MAEVKSKMIKFQPWNQQYKDDWQIVQLPYKPLKEDFKYCKFWIGKFHYEGWSEEFEKACMWENLKR